MKVTIDTEGIKNKITEINHSQSTLNKDFTFKTAFWCNYSGKRTRLWLGLRSGERNTNDSGSF